MADNENQSNVTSIGGPDDAVPGRADPYLVDMLEGLLEDAKNGEIGAFAYVAIRFDRIASRRNWTARSDFSNDLIGRLYRLMTELTNRVNEE